MQGFNFTITANDCQKFEIERQNSSRWHCLCFSYFEKTKNNRWVFCQKVECHKFWFYGCYLFTFKYDFFFQSNTSNAGGKGKKKKEIDPTLLKARVMRETRNIPNLIAKLETFMGNLQKLASKGGLISENFSLCLKSPKGMPNHAPKHLHLDN